MRFKIVVPLWSPVLTGTDLSRATVKVTPLVPRGQTGISLKEGNKGNPQNTCALPKTLLQEALESSGAGPEVHLVHREIEGQDLVPG